MTAAGAVAGKAPSGYSARFPYLLGCLFFFLICIPGSFELSSGISLGMVALLVFFPIWFGAARMRQAQIFDDEARLCTGIILGCTGFLIFWAVLSVLDADDPVRSGRTIVSLVGFASTFLLLIGTATEDRLKTYVGILCWTLAATCVISFLAYFEPTLRRIIFLDTDRAQGFFKNPNQFGMAISTLIPVTVGCSLAAREGRGAWIACFLMLVLGLILSGSKTNLMLSVLTATAMVMAVLFMSYSGAARFQAMIAGLGGIAVFLAAMVALLWILNPRALTILTTFLFEDGEVNSLASRSVLWKDSMRQFIEQPILGQGAGQPLDYIQQNRFVPHSHNVFLEYMRTLGAPGLVAVTVMLGTVIVTGMRSILIALRATTASLSARTMTIGLLLGSLSYVAANLSSDSMGPSTSPFLCATLFLGLIARSVLVGPVARDTPARVRGVSPDYWQGSGP